MMLDDIDKLRNYTVSSVVEGYDAFLLRSLIASSKRDLLYIVSDGMALEQAANILGTIAPHTKVLKFPAWDTVPYDRVSPNANIVAERVNTLAELAANPQTKQPRIIIASIGAAIQKLPPKKIFLNSVREIKVGGNLNFNEFIHYATVNGYNRVEQVMEPGEYAVRGDILDIFPVGTPEPLRIDLFDDEVEKIRTFDALSQRTTGNLEKYTFQVMGEVSLDNNTVKNFRTGYRETFGAVSQSDEIYEAVSEGRKYMGMENWLPFFYEEPLLSIFDYLPMAQIIIGKNVADALKSKEDSIADYYQARLEALNIKSANEVDTYRPVKPELMFFNEAAFNKIIKEKSPLCFTSMSTPDGEGVINAGVIPGRDFSNAKNVGASQVYAELKDYLNENKKLKRIICCYTEGSRERLFSLMAEHGIDEITFAENWEEAEKKAAHKKVVMVLLNLSRGFRSMEYCLISEQDILGERQHRKTTKKASSKDFIADVSSLSIGELVVHIEHGIGKFLGLENITAGGAPHDCLKILYANDAKLFVPVENIDVISRYGIEDDNIQLDTLGGAAWQAKKAKVKERIKDIAEKLIKIAAERHLKKADNFIPPAGSYDEFCAGFPYNETDDQLNAITDVLADLNAGIPMDRLVCGDVGFGKTEIALRAAFAVAMSGAQVALIVPTTLLARQHYYNFKKRMEGFPIRVKMLSRLVSPKEAALTKQGIADGSVEIVIGTHALLSKDLKFCNLGLLIIDEEQHFGVAHKEKLKSLKSDVHVLTLTATPIPRTLQLSLTGVKQLSIIATPPVDRLAARTFVMPFDKVMIKEAIYREKFRNGQVFFVCPRVSDIFGVEKELRELVPDIKILVAHGQMPVSKLEEVMNDFADGKADMLLSTTIIESGIDMPSVNTMIVYRSDMFGLAQLYQLKGRVGRGKVRGYCYFTVPKQKNLKPIAERRLNILQALDTLGAGFSLASHDMDIRGSGNILGEEQSGHIKEVGIALYQHMLEEEIMRMKAGGTDEKQKQIEDWAPQITTGIPIMIPESYVRDLGVRLGLYKRIGEIQDINGLLDIKEELIDRFGALPEEVDNLLKTVEIKQLCRKANVEKVDAGSKGILIAFRNNTFAAPEKLIDFIARQFGAVKIRPDQKLFVEKNLESYKVRVETIKNYISKLVGMLPE
ncbi:MAG: transcription-repair coupling factor [Alphaproteobacteria bacterium]|nr:transcription-repair coupling factor [Alphaproteobacteria bacterium]